MARHARSDNVKQKTDALDAQRTGARESTFYVTLCPALSQQLQTTLGQIDHLALVVVLELVVRFDLAVRNLLDHLHDVIGLTDETDEFLVFRLEQLEQCPDGYVLEGRVAAIEEPAQVAVDAIAGLRPISDEDAVVTN